MDHLANAAACALMVLIPALDLILFVVGVTTNPWRLNRQNRLTRLASLALAALIVTANLVPWVCSSTPWWSPKRSRPDNFSSQCCKC